MANAQPPYQYHNRKLARRPRQQDRCATDAAAPRIMRHGQFRSEAGLARVGHQLTLLTQSPSGPSDLCSMSDETGPCSSHYDAEYTESPAPRTWEARLSTSQLIGLHIRRQRQTEGLTVEVLAHASDHTQEWLRSLERGEFIPTREMLAAVGLGFCRATGDHRWFASTYLDLLADPDSELAKELKEELPNSEFAPDHSEEAPPPAGPLPTAYGLSLVDRVLVLTPLAVGAFLVAGIVVLWFWAKDVEPLEGVSLPWIAFLGATAVTATAFLLPAMNRLFVWATWCVRLGPCREKVRLMANWPKAHGVPLSGRTTWLQPGFSAHIQPRYRGAAFDVGLSADFAERITAVFALATIGALIAFLDGFPGGLVGSFTLNPDTMSRVSALPITLGLLATVTLLSCRAAYTFGLRAHGTLFDGLGIVRSDEPSAALPLGRLRLRFRLRAIAPRLLHLI